MGGLGSAMSSADLATVVIACPHCGTRYQVPFSTIGSDGREVQCAQCGKSWHAHADAPPAFLATGDQDTVVRPRQTRKLAAALREQGARIEEHHYASMGHAGPVLAFARPFRRRSTLLADLTAFLKTAVA